MEVSTVLYFVRKVWDPFGGPPPLSPARLGDRHSTFYNKLQHSTNSEVVVTFGTLESRTGAGDRRSFSGC